jgi:hypothetical protein
MVKKLTGWNTNQISFLIQCYDKDDDRRFAYIVDQNAIYYRRPHPTQQNGLIVESITYQRGFRGPVTLKAEQKMVLERTDILLD